MKIIARTKELLELHRIYKSEEAEFLAVHGRRRVGKTFLIHEFFKDKGLFLEITGLQGGGKSLQIGNFLHVLKNIFDEELELSAKHLSWIDAFEILRALLERRGDGQKKILFFDELPWLAEKKSGFLEALDYYWNRYFSKDPSIVVIVCGSAASWMIRKVICHKGGLHGRLTAQMQIKPFTLKEVEEFFQAKQIDFNRQQILEIYMAIGGVAKYLTFVQRGQSAAQNIQRICFDTGGPLKEEFRKLFFSLFSNYEKHIAIVEALAKKKSGMNQQELFKAVHLQSGGGATLILRELEEAGFIMRVLDFGHKKKHESYRLIDEFSLFYLEWMKESSSLLLAKDYWLRAFRSPSYTAWTGYAFENICFRHLEQIVQALHLELLAQEAASWVYRPKSPEDKGAQIDLIITRSDRSMNLCEIKFSQEEFVLSKDYAQKILYRKNRFAEHIHHKKSLFTTMITTCGVKETQEYLSCIDQQISLDALFE